MKTMSLGQTELLVTPVAYGAMELRNTHFRDGRPFTASDAQLILNKVLDLGINFIDTSPDYGPSEELIGTFISHRRNEFFLASKCGCTEIPGPNGYHVHNWTKQNLISNIENSLRTLKTDHLDLWQLHNPPLAEIIKNDLISVMQDVRQSGKVRFIGASIKKPDADGFIETGAFDTIQLPYSALQPEHRNVINRAADSKIGTIIRGCVSQGSALNTRQEVIDKWDLWLRARLDELLQPGQTRPQFLISYVLADQAVSTAIIGTIDPQHLVQNIKAQDFGPLSPELVMEVDKRISQILCS